MPAARVEDTDYVGEVQVLDWDILYLKHNFGAHLETLRAAWIENFDVVLVDSRTGVTDFSGLTTAQLPDVLVFMFTANNQSLRGCCDIARRAMDARRKLPLDRPALVPLPIPAKFEQHEEYDRAQYWRAQFATELTPFFNIWAPSSLNPLRLVDILTIPYVARWSFGEELATLSELPSTSGARTPNLPLSYALESIGAILANGFAKVDLLYSSRDEYVLTARTVARDRTSARDASQRVFISVTASERPLASQLSEIMQKWGIHSVVRDELREGSSIGAAVSVELEIADALVVIVSDRFKIFESAGNRNKPILTHELPV